MATYSGARPKPLAGLSSAWAGLDGNLKRLTLIGFIEITAVNLYASVLMPYYRSLGYGSSAAGLFTSIIQVVAAVVALGAGLLADTLGRKKLYVAGQLLRCAAAGLLIVTRSYLGLILVSVVRGLATMQSPAQSAIFASYTRKENRGTMLGLTQTVTQAASVGAPLLAGFLAERFGVTTSFGAGLLLACLAVAVAIPLKDRNSAEEGSATPHVATPEQVAAVTVPMTASIGVRLRNMFAENRPAALAALLTATLINGLGNGAIGILLPFIIMDRFSSAYRTVSGSQTFSALGTMLVLLIGGRIADLRGRRGLILITGAIFPFLMTGIFVASALWQLYLVLVLVTMMGNISSPAIGAVYMEAVAQKDRATFAGLQMSLNSAGVALGSVAAGIAYKASGTWSFIAVIALFALQFPLYAVAVPRERRT